MSYRYKKYKKYKRYKRKNYYNENYNINFYISIFIFVLIVGLIDQFLNWFSSLNRGEIFSLFFYTSLLGIAIRYIYKKIIKNKSSVENTGENNHELVKQEFQQPTNNIGFTKKTLGYNDVLKNSSSYISIGDKYNVMQRLRGFYPGYFEKFIQLLFELRGYDIIKSPSYKGVYAMKDGGIDLIVKKEGIETYVQIKKKFSHQTEASVVRELNGSVDKSKGNRMIVSSSIFSDDAKEFAEENSIDLVDYVQLLLLIDNLSEEYKDKLEEFINNDSHINSKFKFKPITCKYCYAPMQKRKGGFYGCMNYYNTGCNYTEKNE